MVFTVWCVGGFHCLMDKWFSLFDPWMVFTVWWINGFHWCVDGFHRLMDKWFSLLDVWMVFSSLPWPPTCWTSWMSTSSTLLMQTCASCWSKFCDTHAVKRRYIISCEPGACFMVNNLQLKAEFDLSLERESTDVRRVRGNGLEIILKPLVSIYAELL